MQRKISHILGFKKTHGQSVPAFVPSTVTQQEALNKYLLTEPMDKWVRMNEWMNEWVCISWPLLCNKVPSWLRTTNSCHFVWLCGWVGWFLLSGWDCLLSPGSAGTSVASHVWQCPGLLVLKGLTGNGPSLLHVISHPPVGYPRLVHRGLALEFQRAAEESKCQDTSTFQISTSHPCCCPFAQWSLTATPRLGHEGVDIELERSLSRIGLLLILSSLSVPIYLNAWVGNLVQSFWNYTSGPELFH